MRYAAKLRLIELLFGIGVVFGSTPALAQDEAAPAVAIVVHPDVAVDNLSMQQLRKIFFAEQQYWGADRSRIILLVRAPTAYERDCVLDRIYRMDENQFRQYWIAKMFRAEIPAGPKIVFSNDMARDLITAIPGSITFMRASDADAKDVKVLRIDGLLPDEPNYPLK